LPPLLLLPLLPLLLLPLLLLALLDPTHRVVASLAAAVQSSQPLQENDVAPTLNATPTQAPFAATVVHR
jgi:hypothetical protein